MRFACSAAAIVAALGLVASAVDAQAATVKDKTVVAAVKSNGAGQGNGNSQGNGQGNANGQANGNSQGDGHSQANGQGNPNSQGNANGQGSANGQGGGNGQVNGNGQDAEPNDGQPGHSANAQTNNGNGSGDPAALTLVGATCGVGDVTIGGYDALACLGAFQGNESNQNLGGLFDTSAWTEIVKIDGPDIQGSAGGLDLLVQPAGGLSGTWSVDGWADWLNVMIVLKGGPTFSTYLIDPTKGLSGTWSTAGILNGNGGASPGLSHFSIYANGKRPPTEPDLPAPVPLPPAAWLLAGGLAGLGLLSRRRT